MQWHTLVGSDLSKSFRPQFNPTTLSAWTQSMIDGPCIPRPLLDYFTQSIIFRWYRHCLPKIGLRRLMVATFASDWCHFTSNFINVACFFYSLITIVLATIYLRFLLGANLWNTQKHTNGKNNLQSTFEINRLSWCSQFFSQRCFPTCSALSKDRIEQTDV